MAVKLMKLQIKYWAEEINEDLDNALEEVAERFGYHCYGTGYHLVENYRELVFDRPGDEPEIKEKFTELMTATKHLKEVMSEELAMR